MFSAMYKAIHQLISNGKFKIRNNIWIHPPIQGMHERYSGVGRWRQTYTNLYVCFCTNATLLHRP